MVGGRAVKATGRAPVRVEVRNAPVGSEEQFARFVKMSVAEAIRRGARTFEELLLALPSVYPTEVLAVMDRLAKLPGVGAEVLTRIRRDARTPRRGQPAGGNLLPLPHPLDFEWRFAEQTCREMVAAAAEMTRKGETILLYGTPGLAYAAMSLPVRSRRVVFAGAETVVTRRLAVLNRATDRPIAMVSASRLAEGYTSAVLVDPPWYPDYLQPMLRSAARVCRADGIVLASLPPAGVRPGIADERVALAEFAEGQGLQLESLEELAVSYETPFFESNALEAAGVFAPAVWRRGDLAVYRRGREPVEECRPEPGDEYWEEVEIDGMRLRVRPDSEAASTTEDLQTLIRGEVLPSVSRREPRRALANVWTSGNRIYRAGNPMVALEAAHACRDGYAPTLWRNLVEEDRFNALIERLREIAAVEGEERRRSAGAAVGRVDRAA